MNADIKGITHHVSWKSAELVTVGTRTYFFYNGKSFFLYGNLLQDVLKEMDDNKIGNPMTAANYLIKQAQSGRFTDLPADRK